MLFLIFISGHQLNQKSFDPGLVLFCISVGLLTHIQFKVKGAGVVFLWTNTFTLRFTDTQTHCVYPWGLTNAFQTFADLLNVLNRTLLSSIFTCLQSSSSLPFLVNYFGHYRWPLLISGITWNRWQECIAFACVSFCAWTIQTGTHCSSTMEVVFSKHVSSSFF